MPVTMATQTATVMLSLSTGAQPTPVQKKEDRREGTQPAPLSRSQLDLHTIQQPSRVIPEPRVEPAHSLRIELVPTTGTQSATEMEATSKPAAEAQPSSVAPAPLPSLVTQQLSSQKSQDLTVWPTTTVRSSFSSSEPQNDAASDLTPETCSLWDTQSSPFWEQPIDVPGFPLAPAPEQAPKMAALVSPPSSVITGSLAPVVGPSFVSADDPFPASGWKSPPAHDSGPTPSPSVESHHFATKVHQTPTKQSQIVSDYEVKSDPIGKPPPVRWGLSRILSVRLQAKPGQWDLLPPSSVLKWSTCVQTMSRLTQWVSRRQLQQPGQTSPSSALT